MLRFSSSCVVLSLFWCSCAAPLRDQATPSPLESLTARQSANTPEASATLEAGGAAMGRNAGATGVTAASPQDAAFESALWNDPDFRRRFAESYMAETDIEPPALSEDETEAMDKVLELRGNGNLDGAIERLRKEATPAANAKLHLTLAKLYIERERFPEAAQALELAVAKFPKFRRAWNDLALIRFREGDFPGAAQAFAKVIEQGGASGQIYGLLGSAHAKNEDQIAAESAFRMAILLEPTKTPWRMQLGKCFFNQGRFADAVSLLSALIDAEPDRGELWQLQAQAYLGLHEATKAAENLEVVDRLGQSTAESLNILGNVYVNQEVYDLAARAYQRAIDKADAKKGLAMALPAAKALAVRGANAETQQLLDVIDAKFGTQLDDKAKKEVLWLRSRLALATGGGEEAEAKVLEQIAALDPLDGDVLIRLGRFYEHHGRIEDAVFRYESAEGLQDFEADAKVCHAQLLVRQGKHAEALPLLRRAQTLKPRDSVQQFLEQVERIGTLKN